MAITNYERVGKAMELLKDGLSPFVEREVKSTYSGRAVAEISRIMKDDRQITGQPIKAWDSAALLRFMWEGWNDIFRKTLGQAERSLVSELRNVRNKWAHQEPFSGDDAYRALDSMSRLLVAVSAPQASEIDKMKMELMRVRFDEQVRTEKRKAAETMFESQAASNLKPWREVVNPHHDVASGKYQQAEFAADLWQVHIGEGSDEYRKPVEFFRRTYLTESLKLLLTGAIERISGKGGDPVVQLQTNFGGGKTHSMLALYHLFSESPLKDLLGVDNILKNAKVDKLLAVKRVVLVGNRISPGNPIIKPDGTTIRTLWGEIAWQLGGKKAYELLRADDEKATSPGDTLRILFNEYGPCLILIDEWVSYARQLHDQGDLPAGTFETQFTFAQALTESAKLAKQCLLVISLPASDTTGSPHTQADDTEVGGQRGREALDRLRNVIGRVESSWRPASAEEGFEIVRRRLFEPLIDKDQFVARDTVARAFHDSYQTQQQEFPAECRNAEYENRLKAAYPIHPEVFDRLYSDWSTLVKFQRTRGILRLMAAVIYSLWEKGDRNPLILPCNIPISDSRVQFELTRYLSDNWIPVIEKDVDGPSSLPLRLDNEIPNLGKFSACRRVARTIYLGSAPTTNAANRGIEDRRIKLGCVMPGESPAVFGDAMRRLSSAATYLYQDGPRYWYSTQPTVTQMAAERAEDLKRNIDAVNREIERRIRLDLKNQGEFSRIHAFPQSGQDVPDDFDARLVVLGTEYPYIKEPNNPAESAAKAILETRGSSQRFYRNTLVFMAVDKTRLQDLDEAVRRYMAWDSILSDRESLDLSPHQVKQAEMQKASADGVVNSRIPEAYQWLLVPIQANPQTPLEWKPFRLSGQESIAIRASKKLRNDDLLITRMAATSLRMELDKIPLWRGDHVEIKQVAEDFAKYFYLPRLKDTSVLLAAVHGGLGLLLWRQESFAYADSYDEIGKRYRGLRCGQPGDFLGSNLSGLIVKPEVAEKQYKSDTEAAVSNGNTNRGASPGDQSETGSSSAPNGSGAPATSGKVKAPKRFYGSVSLDPSRTGRDASRIAEEVIAHLIALAGAEIKVTLEIDASIPSGTPENVVRTVTENSRTLKFTGHGFEDE
ncbi:MAG: Swt1 family HEPN domain-containing protein [Dehalococcoidia bacterium]|jgi:predicted AAA+ superfamily ATPase